MKNRLSCLFSFSFDIDRFLNRCLALAIFLQIVAAIFSYGYHHPDEHYQIYEVVNYKLGQTPHKKLSWEYQKDAQIRPNVQVFSFYFIAKVLYYFDITNPFTIATITRLLAGLLGLYALYLCCLYIKTQIQRKTIQKLAIASTALFSFLPYINARVSSEVIGANLFFIFCFQFLLTKNDDLNFKKLLVYSFFICLSFYIRFQLAFLIIPFFVWATLQKLKARMYLPIVTGAMIALMMGLLCDHWIYGELVFSPYNYFYQNIIHNQAVEWGSQPWYFYLGLPLVFYPPISLLGLPLFYIALFRFIKRPIVLTVFVFIISHSVVGHKEIRFMFSIVLVFPMIILMGYELLHETLDRFSRLLSIVFKFSLGLNFIVMAFMILRPANFEIKFFNFAYEYFQKQKSIELVTLQRGPYTIGEPETFFYRPNNFKLIRVKSISELEGMIKVKPLCFFNEKMLLPKLTKETTNLHKWCQPRYRPLPGFTLKLNFGNWMSKNAMWSLWYCEKK